MDNQNYNVTLTVSKTANEVFKSINSVSKWWTENLKGDSENLNGVFTADFGNDNFVTHKLIEVVPNQKVMWLVTDCYLSRLKDKTEWANTKMIFEISINDNKTQISFTHIGLVPEIECYGYVCKRLEPICKRQFAQLNNRWGRTTTKESAIKNLPPTTKTSSSLQGQR